MVATTKIGRVVEADDDVAWMETRPHGVEVAIPSLPAMSEVAEVEVEVKEPMVKFPTDEEER